MKSSTISVNISIQTERFLPSESEPQKQAGHFSRKSVSINHISASDESPKNLSTGGLEYQIENSEAERKNQPRKERNLCLFKAVSEKDPRGTAR